MELAGMVAFSGTCQDPGVWLANGGDRWGGSRMRRAGATAGFGREQLHSRLCIWMEEIRGASPGEMVQNSMQVPIAIGTYTVA